MNTDLVEAQKIEGVQNQAEAYVTDGYPEKMTLIFGSKNGIVSEKTNLIKKELFSIMEEKTKSGMYLFSPIHFREREIGYLVLSDCDYMLENQFLFETLNTFTESLEYLYGKIVLRRIKKAVILGKTVHAVRIITVFYSYKLSRFHKIQNAAIIHINICKFFFFHDSSMGID